MIDTLKIFIRCTNQAMTAGEFSVLCKKLLTQIKPVIPHIEEIYSWGDSRKTSKPIETDLSDIETSLIEMFKKIYKKNILATGFDGKRIADAYNSIDFSGFFTINKDHHDWINVDMRAGNKDGDGSLVLNYEFDKTNSLLSFDFIITLLALNARFANEFKGGLNESFYGMVLTDSFRKQVYLMRPQLHWIGWINYYANPKVAALLPDDVEKHVLDDGGVIFWLSKEMPEATYSVAVEKALAIHRILMENHIFDKKTQL